VGARWGIGALGPSAITVALAKGMRHRCGTCRGDPRMWLFQGELDVVKRKKPHKMWGLSD